MVKECKVLLNNIAVAVADFDGIQVQIPPIAEDAKTVMIEFIDGKYTVAEDREAVKEAVEEIPAEEAEEEKTAKKPRKKKPVDAIDE